LRKLFIPTAVIGGFLILGLGPEGMGRLIGGAGLFPENVFSVWRQLPAHLVTLMSASLLLGEHLRPVRKIWRLSGAHVIMVSVMVAPLIILAVAAIGWSVFVTDVVRGYSYRQIITRPILGGGFVTALAVPLIARFGLPAFPIAAAATTAALIAWGIKRAGHGGRGLESVERGVMLPSP
jgi:Na+/glutamate symporter